MLNGLKAGKINSLDILLCLNLDITARIAEFRVERWRESEP